MMKCPDGYYREIKDYEPLLQLNGYKNKIGSSPLDKKFKFIKVEGNGNCVLESFLQSLGVKGDAQNLRLIYVNWLKKNPTHINTKSKMNDDDLLYLKSKQNFYLINEDIENICNIMDVQLVICVKGEPIQIKYKKDNDNFIYWESEEAHYNVLYTDPPANSVKLLKIFLENKSEPIKSTRIISKKQCQICSKNINDLDNDAKVSHYSKCFNSSIKSCDVCDKNIYHLNEEEREKHVQECVNKCFLK
jgi:hypothetical protein